MAQLYIFRSCLVFDVIVRYGSRERRISAEDAAGSNDGYKTEHDGVRATMAGNSSIIFEEHRIEACKFVALCVVRRCAKDGRMRSGAKW